MLNLDCNQIHLLHFFCDRGPVQEKLVSDNRVARHDDQPALGIDLKRMRISCIGWADDRRPVFADGVLGGFDADAVADHEFIHQR